VKGTRTFRIYKITEFAEQYSSQHMVSIFLYRPRDISVHLNTIFILRKIL